MLCGNQRGECEDGEMAISPGFFIFVRAKK